MTRNELIIKLAVASYAPYDAENAQASWIRRSIYDADALLAALDKESSPTHDADCALLNTTEAACDCTAAPGGEPKERVCVWTAKPGWSAPACQATQQLEWRESTAAAFKFCPHCGGKIITEAT